MSESAGLIREIVFIAGAMGVVVAFVCMVPGYFWVVRPFDELTLKHEGLFDRMTPIGGGWFRFTKYAVAIAFPNHVRRNARAVSIFSEFDYRAHASRGQVVLSYLFVCSWLVALPCALVFFGIDKWYGIDPQGVRR